MTNKKITISLSIFFGLLMCLGFFIYEFDLDEHIYISEICPKNKYAAYDDNYVFGDDYIEIYNSSLFTLEINDMYLSDDKNDLNKYKLDGIKISSGSTILVWNNEDSGDIENYSDNYVPYDFHDLGFGIKPGETVYLSNDKGKIIQEVKTPSKISTDESYSSSKRNLNEFVISNPTPHDVEEKANELMEVDAHLDAPTFSVDGGFYDDNLLLSLSSEEGTIYYTIDGSEPTLDSNKYEKEIIIKNKTNDKNNLASIDGISLIYDAACTDKIDKGTVVKAMVVKNGRRSEIVSQTYFVGLNKEDYENVSIMEITIDEDDFFNHYSGIYKIGYTYKNYINKYGHSDIGHNNGSGYEYDSGDSGLGSNFKHLYANYAMEGKAWERESYIEYYDENHNKVLTQDVGIRIQGGWSTGNNQKSFNIYAREEYDGNSTLGYDFYGYESDKIRLRAGGVRDTYYTKLRDVFNQSLVESRDIGTQSSKPCAVFINGEYWGLYNIQETISENYISNKYGIDEDNILYMKNSECNKEVEGVESYEDIVEFAENNDLSIEENYKYITDRIDIDSYIDYWIFQVYIANCDSVANNFARWRSINVSDKEYEDGKWRYLLYDTDDSTGMITARTSYDIDSFIEGNWTRNLIGENGDAMFMSLLENDEFKNKFKETFYEMANECFDYETVSNKLNSLSSLYETQVIKSNNRFRLGDYFDEYENDTYDLKTYTKEDYQNDINVIDEFYKNRYEYITKYLEEDIK